MKPGRHVLIVGGGASGVLMACHLLKDAADSVQVTLFERRPDVGLGIAYGTADPRHLLNIRASNMSAYPDDPDHFWRWMIANGEHETLPCPDPFCFVPRPVYGRYVSQLIETHLAETPSRLQIVQTECVSITETRKGVEVRLADATSCYGDIAVLATGNEAPQQLQQVFAAPWSGRSEQGHTSNDTVLILGTGLTMVDQVLTLVHSGHTGRIVAMSRRGLLPQAHRRVAPWPIRRYEIPFGKDISVLLQWIRKTVQSCEDRGGDWRSVIDGLRPYMGELWRRLSPRARARFLEHARPWWDVHRHRMAPEVDAHVRMLISSGRLTILAARTLAIEPADAGARIVLRKRGAAQIETMQVERVIDCRGVDNNPKRTRNPILRSLLDKGLGRPDPLNLGLEVNERCAILDVFGRPSRRLYAIGPLTRPTFWEILAVPDIRVQCSDLAAHLQQDQPAARIAMR